MAARDQQQGITGAVHAIRERRESRPTPHRRRSSTTRIEDPGTRRRERHQVLHHSSPPAATIPDATSARLDGEMPSGSATLRRGRMSRRRAHDSPNELDQQSNAGRRWTSPHRIGMTPGAARFSRHYSPGWERWLPYTELNRLRLRPRLREDRGPGAARGTRRHEPMIEITTYAGTAEDYRTPCSNETPSRRRSPLSSADHLAKRIEDHPPRSPTQP